MKIISKILCLALLLGIALACLPAFAAEDSAGIWSKVYYVDEFDLPTDESFITNLVPFTGKFSNSATTDSLLNAHLFYDDETQRFTVRLLEYGDHVVKNSYSSKRDYTVTMMAPDGTKYALEGHMSAESDVLSVYPTSVIARALFQNGTVRFSIQEGVTKYLFVIDDSTGFADVIGSSIYDGIYERGDFSEGFAVIKKAGCYDYIDAQGNILGSYDWDNAYAFSEGLAVVKKDGKWGYIDTTGKLVIPCKFESADNFSEGLASVRTSDYDFGVIDKTGSFVIQPRQVSTSSYHDGLARIRSYKIGFINADGEVVISTDWDDASEFKNGYATVNIGKVNNALDSSKNQPGKWGIIDTAGNTVVACEWDNIINFSEGLAAVKKGDNWGFVDTTGKLVITDRWNAVGSFSEGLAVVRGTNLLCGAIDTTGEVVIPCQWKSIGNFSEGLAAVKTEDGKSGYINAAGEIVIPCEFGSASAFKNGMAIVQNQENYLFGVIDTEGNLIIPCEYNYMRSFVEGYAYVEKKGKWGFIDVNGNMVISE